MNDNYDDDDGNSDMMRWAFDYDERDICEFQFHNDLKWFPTRNDSAHHTTHICPSISKTIIMQIGDVIKFIIQNNKLVKNLLCKIRKMWWHSFVMYCSALLWWGLLSVSASGGGSVLNSFPLRLRCCHDVWQHRMKDHFTSGHGNSPRHF